jgi:hypothetical protein
VWEGGQSSFVLVIIKIKKIIMYLLFVDVVIQRIIGHSRRQHRYRQTTYKPDEEKRKIKDSRSKV